jgi:hypothetical protein
MGNGTNYVAKHVYSFRFGKFYAIITCMTKLFASIKHALSFLVWFLIYLMKFSGVA